MWTQNWSFEAPRHQRNKLHMRSHSERLYGIKWTRGILMKFSFLFSHLHAHSADKGLQGGAPVVFTLFHLMGVRHLKWAEMYPLGKTSTQGGRKWAGSAQEHFEEEHECRFQWSIWLSVAEKTKASASFSVTDVSSRDRLHPNKETDSSLALQQEAQQSVFFIFSLGDFPSESAVNKSLQDAE